MLNISGEPAQPPDVSVPRPRSSRLHPHPFPTFPFRHSRGSGSNVYTPLAYINCSAQLQRQTSAVGMPVRRLPVRGGQSLDSVARKKATFHCARLSVDGALRFTLGLRRFGRFAGARDDESLDCTYLLGMQDFLEGWHAGRGPTSAQNDCLDPFKGLFTGVAKIGRRAGHDVRSVAAGAVVAVEQLSLIHHLRRGARRNGRCRRWVLVAKGRSLKSRGAAQPEREQPTISWFHRAPGRVVIQTHGTAPSR